MALRLGACLGSAPIFAVDGSQKPKTPERTNSQPLPKISRQEHHDHRPKKYSPMTDKDQIQMASALKAALISPNEPDRGGEPANIVDGLFAIARAID
jgi:hypothetical protein